MTVAMRNTQNSISMMQTAEGALDETTNILVRMKDLATQSSDGSSTDADRTAMQAEFDALGKELTNIVANTSFGGTSLLGTKAGSKFGAGTAVTFQIGTSSSETMSVDLTTELTAMNTVGLVGASAHFGADGVDPAGATTVGTEIATAPPPTPRSTSWHRHRQRVDRALGTGCRVEPSGPRLQQPGQRIDQHQGRYRPHHGHRLRAESSNMTSAQMLLQAGTAMLKQSNSTSSLVMSLLQ
jgi:flagellin